MFGYLSGIGRVRSLPGREDGGVGIAEFRDPVLQLRPKLFSGQFCDVRVAGADALPVQSAQLEIGIDVFDHGSDPRDDPVVAGEVGEGQRVLV